MKRRWLALAATIAMIANACSVASLSPSTSPSTGGAGGGGSSQPASPAGGPITVTDALGRSVTLPALPTRIAISGKASFLIADAVFMFPEASSRVVALAKATQGSEDFIAAIDPAYSRKTILDGNAGAEQVAAVRPDVVIMKSSSAESLGEPLQAIGIKVVYVDFETPEQYDRDLATLGLLFGDVPRATELAGYFDAQVSRVSTSVVAAAGGHKPGILLLYYSAKNGTAAFQVPPLGYIQSTEASIAGGDLVWKGAQLGSGWTTVSLEQIAAWNPDQVFVIAYFDKVEDVVAGLYADPQWRGLAAVESHAVYGFPGDYYSWDEPDPRWALGLTWLAGRIHPGLAAEFDMSKQVRDFYATAYGMDDATFDTQVKPYLPAGIN